MHTYLAEDELGISRVQGLAALRFSVWLCILAATVLRGNRVVDQGSTLNPQAYYLSWLLYGTWNHGAPRPKH